MAQDSDISHVRDHTLSVKCPLHTFPRTSAREAVERRLFVTNVVTRRRQRDGGRGGAAAEVSKGTLSSWVLY